MTFAELKAEVFRRLEEAASAPVFWTDADVALALNDGYQEISDATEWCEDIFTLALLRERPYYDVRFLTPRPVLRLTAAFNNQTQRWLTPCVPTDLDAGYRRWETVTGEPTHQMVRGLWFLGLWPMADEEHGSIQQHFTTLPASLRLAADEPGFPETVHYGLVEYALADLWAQDAEATKATTAWQTYLAFEAALMDWVQGRAAVPLVHGHHTAAPG